MNFKEYYIEEGWKTDFAKKVAKAPFKLGAGLAKAGYRGAKAIYDDPEGYIPTVKKAGQMLKSLPGKMTGYAPEYEKQFKSPGGAAYSRDGGDVLSGKTMGEIQQKVLKWRTNHITSKDGTPAAVRAEQELASIAAPPGGTGAAPAIEFRPDGKFTDSGYILPGTTDPKVFDHIGHYANTVLDSMLSYAQKGYPLNEIERFLRFDKAALNLLKKHDMYLTKP